MDRFEALVAEASEAPVSGWDFGFVAGRLVEEPLPWSYAERAGTLVRAAGSPVLDQGTGGGEFLASLAPLPPGSQATEDWHPNVPVARRRLSELSVQVIAPESVDRLPVPSGRFAVVLNRHSSFGPGEVRRVLLPDGVFFTQQVGADDGIELSAALAGPAPERDQAWDARNAAAGLHRAGMRVVRTEECRVSRRFHDIGALVFYLRMVPWQVPGFDVSAYRPGLQHLHERMEREGALACSVHRFLLEAVPG